MGMPKTEAAMTVKRQRQQILQNMRKVTRTTIPQNIERLMTGIGVAVGNKALEYTPLDTSALINSKFRHVGRTDVRIGYTQGYAAALHNRDDWQPKQPGTPGKKGGGWNPAAKSGFLTEAAREEMPTINRLKNQELKL